MRKLKVITNGVGKRILSIRTAQELTQAAFGAEIGISEGYVGMMENGRRKPSQGLIIAISFRFGVDEDWLRRGTKKRGEGTNATSR